MLSYAVPDSGNFRFSWSAGLDGGPQFAIKGKDRVIEDWTKGQDLSVSVEIDVRSMDEYYLDLIENHGLSLGLSLSWFSDSGTSLRDNIMALKITDIPSIYTVEGVINGEMIAGAVTVKLSCIVFTPDDMNHFSKGLILFSDERKLIIEGQGSQFPITIVNFLEDPSLKNYSSSFFVLSRRVEYLDYDCYFFNEYELKLNSLCPATAFVNMPMSLENKDQKAIVNLLMFNVYMEIISDMRVLKSKGYDLLEWVEDNTLDNQLVGSVMYELVSLLAPSLSDGDRSVAYNVILDKDSDVKIILQEMIFNEE